jgi:hypothetical protein
LVRIRNAFYDFKLGVVNDDYVRQIKKNRSCILFLISEAEKNHDKIKIVCAVIEIRLGKNAGSIQGKRVAVETICVFSVMSFLRKVIGYNTTVVVLHK